MSTIVTKIKQQQKEQHRSTARTFSKRRHYRQPNKLRNLLYWSEVKRTCCRRERRGSGRKVEPGFRRAPRGWWGIGWTLHCWCVRPGGRECRTTTARFPARHQLHCHDRQHDIWFTTGSYETRLETVRQRHRHCTADSVQVVSDFGGDS